MNCENCKTPGRPGARFCMTCGARLQVRSRRQIGWGFNQSLKLFSFLAALTVSWVWFTNRASRGLYTLVHNSPLGAGSRAAERFSAGQDYLEKEQWSEALKEFDESIKLDASKANRWYVRGYCHERLGEEEAARSDYLESIRLEPKEAAPRLALANQYARLEMPDEALHAYKDLLPFSPDNAKAVLGMARAYFRLKRWDDAAAGFAKYLKTSPDDAAGVAGLARSRFSTGNLIQAKEAYERLLKLQPESSEGRYYLGLSDLELGDREGALLEYRKLEELARSGADEDASDRARSLKSRLDH